MVKCEIRFREGSPYSFDVTFENGSTYASHMPEVIGVSEEDGEYTLWQATFGSKKEKSRLRVSFEKEQP